MRRQIIDNCTIIESQTRSQAKSGDDVTNVDYIKTVWQTDIQITSKDHCHKILAIQSTIWSGPTEIKRGVNQCEFS